MRSPHIRRPAFLPACLLAVLAAVTVLGAVWWKRWRPARRRGESGAPQYTSSGRFIRFQDDAEAPSLQQPVHRFNGQTVELSSSRM